MLVSNSTVRAATLTREVTGSNPGKGHCWRQEGHPVQKCSLLQQSPN